MDSNCSLTSPGLQDWFTDLDGWICRFSANVSVSRSQSKRDKIANLDTCTNCSRDQKITKNSHFTPQTCSETQVKLHEIMVNGLLFAQKRQDTYRTIEDFLNIFKGNDDFPHYDYVLTTVKENGRKSIQKYIRSKI